MGLSSGSLMAADKKLIPHLIPAQEPPIKGVPSYSYSTCMECPAGCGISVKVREGKPVKLEGHPYHPVNSGGLCMRGQASLARLYHPERIRQPLFQNKPISWEKALVMLRERLQSSQKSAVLSSHTTGTLSDIIRQFGEQFKTEILPEFELLNYSAIKKAYEILFNIPRIPRYDFENCDMILSLGMDLTNTFISPVGFARSIARGRRKGLRWIQLESHQTLSGLGADHRFGIRPGSEPSLLSYLLQELRFKIPLDEAVKSSLPKLTPKVVAEHLGITEKEVHEIRRQVAKSRKPLVLAGESATAQVNGLLTALLSGLLQWQCGLIPRIVDFNMAINDPYVGNAEDFQRLSQRLINQEIKTLLVSRINDFPLFPQMRKGLEKVEFKVGLMDIPNPLMDLYDLILPVAHPLECWGDSEVQKGLCSLIQPVMHPLGESRSEGDILLDLMKRPESYQQILFNQWGDQRDSLLKQGFRMMPLSYLRVEPQVKAVADTIKANPSQLSKPQPLLVLNPSHRYFDGRSEGLQLLKEIPDAISSVSYGRFVSVSTNMAQRYQLNNRDEVLVQTEAGEVKAPVRIIETLPSEVMMLPHHWGGDLSPEVMASSGELKHLLKIKQITKTGEKIPIPILSGSNSPKGRKIFPEKSDHHHHSGQETLYPEVKHLDYHWTMAIDLDACNGCSACVAACYIENNVPMAGQEEHLRGAEMSWMRIEPYRIQSHRMEFVPMLCQHCDAAPCEPVCPVFATYHNPEGLNAQVYNRCVGTRYCSNNCPFKVRRFNWSDNQQRMPLYTMVNPEVSRRPKGVMEKCSFCVQRIRMAKDTAKDEKRTVKDEEVIPACAQTCPNGAIVFGNSLDSNSRIYRLIHSEGAYRILEQLGTRPSVYYLKRRS